MSDEKTLENSASLNALHARLMSVRASKTAATTMLDQAEREILRLNEDEANLVAALRTLGQAD